MSYRFCIGTVAGVIALLGVPHAAKAQRSADNALTNADDAFGTQLGNESSGIYSENDARGFSPLKAGNGRLDGIYFDPVANVSGRLKTSTAIRIGYAAHNYPFPAPTGIADTKLRSAGNTKQGSLLLMRLHYGGELSELDVQLPVIKDRLSVAMGFGQSWFPSVDGSSLLSWNILLKPVIRFGQGEISPFYALGRTVDSLPKPLVVVNGAFLPKVLPREEYIGQRWAKGRNTNDNVGVTIKAPLADGLSVRAGLFHSEALKKENYSEIFNVIDPSGLSNHLFIADPRLDAYSLSGEAQFHYVFGSGRARHRLIAGFRGRDRHTESGGSDRRNFGLVILGEKDPEPEPTFAFAAINKGKVRQSSLLLGYIGEVERLGQINLGLQKARYHAVLREGATEAISESRDDPWLYNASLALDVTPKLALYTSTQRGLEDSGTAPENAANRNEQLPAARTSQYEGGLRWKFATGQLVLSAFQITRPYFSFDGANRYIRLGDERHRGIEGSLSAHFVPRLSLLAGAVLMKPTVTGPGRTLGLVGERPAGTPSLYARVDLNYRTDLLGGLTPVATFIYTGRRAAGSRPQPALDGEQLMLPARATLDLGLRGLYRLGRFPASYRLMMNNVFDVKGWKVIAPNTIQLDDRRRVSLSLTVDF